MKSQCNQWDQFYSLIQTKMKKNTKENKNQTTVQAQGCDRTIVFYCISKRKSTFIRKIVPLKKTNNRELNDYNFDKQTIKIQSGNAFIHTESICNAWNVFIFQKLPCLKKEQNKSNSTKKHRTNYPS